MKIKRVRKKPKAWLYPSAIEREYVRFLLSIGDKITGEITKKLPEIQPHFERHLKQDGLSDILAQWLEEILVAVSAFVSNEKIKSLINKYLGEVQAFNRNQFHKALKSAYGVNIFVTEPFLMDELALFELENLRLIKALPTQYVEQLRGKFTEAVRKGTRWEEVAKEIQRDLPDKLRNRAKLIARDQIGKLNGQLTKLRQRNIGVTHYIWRGMLDERERQLHVDREGEKFAWDNPPEDGHPGEAILCRCYAEAVFPDADELAEQKNVLGSDGEIKYSPILQKEILPVVNTVALKGAKFDKNQIYRKYLKHAGIFKGLPINSNRTENLIALQTAIIAHLNSKKTFEYGTYGYIPKSKVYYNYETHIAIVFDEDNNFVTAIIPTNNQLKHYMKKGYLR